MQFFMILPYIACNMQNMQKKYAQYAKYVNVIFKMRNMHSNFADDFNFN
jgi:hypothetical protein